MELRAVLDVYDAAGGGLLAGGLAYAALVAVLPGLLLGLSVVGLVVGSPAERERIVAFIAQALPPLEDVARSALDQVSARAVPTGVLAIAGLVWGSSRFYSSLDVAFARVFQDARQRNTLERIARGVVVTALFVVLPVVVLTFGTVAGWLLDVAPGGSEVGGIARVVVSAVSPLGSLGLFFVGTALVLRFVPARRVPTRALLVPAMIAAVVLAAFTQAFTFIAPRLVGVAALYGAFVAVFAVLAWLSVGFNVLLLGASWTRVRAGVAALPGSGEAAAN
jgi:membrane protein